MFRPHTHRLATVTLISAACVAGAHEYHAGKHRGKTRCVASGDRQDRAHTRSGFWTSAGHGRPGLPHCTPLYRGKCRRRDGAMHREFSYSGTMERNASTQTAKHVRMIATSTKHRPGGGGL
jgi:hypothetical protein